MATTHDVTRLAPAPRIASPLALLQAQDAFTVGIGRTARRLLRSVPDLTQSDRYLLHDLKRSEIRRPMKPLIALVSIAARSELPHHRLSVSENVRALELRLGRVSVEVDPALDQEDLDNASFDTATRRFRTNPSAQTWAAAVEAGEQQLASTRAVLDALYAAHWQAA